MVLHGTDTMSYSSSGISFMIENLKKTIVFTGAQSKLFSIQSRWARCVTTQSAIYFAP